MSVGAKIGVVLLVILGIIGLVAASIGLEYGGLAWKSHFKPKHQAVERKTFKESLSYTDGMAQEAMKLYDEYRRGDESEQRMVANVVRMKLAEFDYSKISNPALRQWVDDIMNYRVP